MTFEEILDQAIAMLQRRGRLTYGALKRQFQLDDAYLEDVKAELIEGQRLAVDEDGRVLVWTGCADAPSLTTPPAPQLGPPPATSGVQPIQVLPPPAAPQSPDAERRQLTVMFCDLVDSTPLASQLDPEDLREVVRAYQETASEVALLLERWAHSQDGVGQVVLLRGEAGIGKSRLVEVLRERVISEGATRIVFRCSSYHRNSALYPVIDHLQRFLQWQRDETPEAKFDTLEQALSTYRLPLEDVVPVFAALLSVPLPAELLYQRGLPPHSRYIFKHALIQDAAYQSLLRSTRQQYHQRIARVLEAQFPEIAETQPELVAHHYTEAGLIEQAVGYWHKAGQSAVQRSAHVEVISHLTKGLELLQTLPETPGRLQREVDML